MSKITIVLVTALIAIAACQERKSPCPDRFKYDADAGTKTNQWSGTLNLLTEYKLFGAWVRLFFDAPVKNVRATTPGFDVIQSPEEPTEVLVKSRNFIIRKNVPEELRVTVGYEGDKVPALTGYRLNARNVCPLSDE